MSSTPPRSTVQSSPRSSLRRVGTAGGNLPSGKIADSIAELYFLSLIEAPRRMLMLTTLEFHKILCRKLEGKVASGLEIVCESLPPDVQAEVEAV
jgi:hypothetical protein